ncbi:hypothetical protein HAX54_027805 [Datura stramonium]|uniref:Uncharacterized protein n=1 Tax=Datura stramonium TaxID=4076 RepID=A0ABS8V5B5_DATST|nr:hypothetical protein [Datura stramonium]
MAKPSSTPAGDKEIRETFNIIDEQIERIKVGLERMMVVLEKMAKREELKVVAAAKSQSTFDHKEKMESKVSGPTSDHKDITLIYSSSVNSSKPLFTCTLPRSPETKTLPNMILDHPHFGYNEKRLNVNSLYSGTDERNNEIEAFEDLFLDVFYIDNESDVEALEAMHIGWLILDNESDMDAGKMLAELPSTLDNVNFFMGMKEKLEKLELDECEAFNVETKETK